MVTLLLTGLGRMPSVIHPKVRCRTVLLVERKMLALREVLQGNPFVEHPVLRTIWPAPYDRFAEEAVAEGIVDGPLFLIVQHESTPFGANRSIERVVGITGLFTEHDHGTDLFLRWHGVLPQERRQGLSGQALDLLVDVARSRYPRFERLVEWVPCNAYGEALVPHFERCGFVKSGVPETEDWIDHAWQAYAKPLRPAPTL